MKIFIILFNLFIIAIAGALIFSPRAFTEFLLRNAAGLWMHVSAVVARIAIGIALILYADLSRFPTTLEILGWLFLVAGIVLALVPPSKFKALVEWAFTSFGKYARLAGVCAVLFAAFLMYAVI